LCPESCVLCLVSCSLKPNNVPDLTPVLALLAETRSLSLATLDPDGRPRATPLFFAFDDQACLFFLSERETQHCRNLSRDSSAAASLYPEVADWHEIRGLQIRGFASVVPASEREPALALYTTRFPFAGELGGIVSLSEIYCLHPTWVRLIDNRQGFGYKREWNLP